ncbi:hypothetical protein NPIL_568791 [Nephila pilipes]|uniref:Uncharacterized protein n=1 Tax=Nephila pilipes TaxID=299642 RepID=A0A8X6QT07_NEPPI|nr:hypothetical protein NPIL_568791 [Nephila pilipes]
MFRAHLSYPKPVGGQARQFVSEEASSRMIKCSIIQAGRSREPRSNPIPAGTQYILTTFKDSRALDVTVSGPAKWLSLGGWKAKRTAKAYTNSDPGTPHLSRKDLLRERQRPKYLKCRADTENADRSGHETDQTANLNRRPQCLFLLSTPVLYSSSCGSLSLPF